MNNKHIVVLTNGFVFMGVIETYTETLFRLVEAENIRVYGTTAGLGQIALHGPTTETKLDPVGVVEVRGASMSNILFVIPCVYE